MMDTNDRRSIIHHTPPALKLLFLLLTSLFLFVLPSLGMIIPAFAITFLLYFLADISPPKALQYLRPIGWLLTALFLVGFFTQNWQQGLVVGVRLGVIFLIANLVTLTTPTSQMMATFERIFVFFKPLGVNPAKIALVLSLTLRFIPVLAQIVAQVREAQKVRGLERNLIATIIPVLIRMFKMGDDIASAIEARGYED